MAMAGKRAEFFFDFAAALFGLRRLGDVRARQQRLRRNILEIALREGESFGRLEIAEHQEHGVIWRVIGAEEMSARRRAWRRRDRRNRRKNCGRWANCEMRPAADRARESRRKAGSSR